MTQGAIYGGYRLLGRLNTGGMAEVFLTRSLADARPDALLALKRILPHFSEDEHFVSMFTDEAHIAQGLHHPNICEIYDLGEHDGLLYMVMEFIHGKDLHVLRHRAQKRGEQAPYPLTAHIIAQIADALDYSHHRITASGLPEGIVHRDVSPPNILISYDGVPKLIDFGVAKAAFRVAQTQAGRIKGKFSYMSPEQARGEPVDGRSDIFSLGIVLYELLTGELPFPGDNHFAVLRRIASGQIVAPLQTDPRLPTELVAVLDRALAARPEERYARASMMASDLRSYLNLGGHSMTAAKVSAYLRRLFREEYVREGQRIRDMLDEAPREQAFDGQATGFAGSADQTLIAATPFLAAGYEDTAAAAAQEISHTRSNAAGAPPDIPPNAQGSPSTPPIVETPVPPSRRVGAEILEIIALPATDTDPGAPLPARSYHRPANTALPDRHAAANPMPMDGHDVTAPLGDSPLLQRAARQRQKRLMTALAVMLGVAGTAIMAMLLS